MLCIQLWFFRFLLGFWLTGFGGFGCQKTGCRRTVQGLRFGSGGGTAASQLSLNPGDTGLFLTGYL